MAIWKYSPGRGARFWDFCLGNELIAMGWAETNDLTWVDSLDEMKDVCHSVGYSINGPRTSDKQLWDFRNIQENDIVVAYGKGKILGVGIVISPYFYNNSKERAIYTTKEEVRYPHRYKVKWISKNEVDISDDSIVYGDPPNTYGTLSTEDTIHKIVDDYTIKFIKKLVLKGIFSRKKHF